MTIPSNLDRTITVTEDISVLSTDPNDLGQCPTFFDSLSERAATTLAYDLAGDADQSVSDVPLLNAAVTPSTAAMVLGADPHGTTYVIGMVSKYKIVKTKIQRYFKVHQLAPVDDAAGTDGAPGDTDPSVISYRSDETHPSRITVSSGEWTLASRISINTDATWETLPSLEPGEPSEPSSFDPSIPTDEPSSMTPLESTPMADSEWSTIATSSNAPNTSTDVSRDLSTITVNFSSTGDSAGGSGEIGTSEEEVEGTTIGTTSAFVTSSSAPYVTTTDTTTTPYVSTTATEPSTLATTTENTSVSSAVPSTISTDPSTPGSESSSAPPSDPSSVPTTTLHESPEEPSSVDPDITLESSLQTEYGPHPADPNMNLFDMEIQGTARVAALDTARWIRDTILCTHLSAAHKLLLVSFYYIVRKMS